MTIMYIRIVEASHGPSMGNLWGLLLVTCKISSMQVMILWLLYYAIYVMFYHSSNSKISILLMYNSYEGNVSPVTGTMHLYVCVICACNPVR